MGNESDRTTRDLGNMMFDEFENLVKGSSTPQQARAKAAVANTIVAISRLEMDYSRFVTDARSDSSLTGPQPIAIGNK